MAPEIRLYQVRTPQVRALDGSEGPYLLLTDPPCYVPRDVFEALFELVEPVRARKARPAQPQAVKAQAREEEAEDVQEDGVPGNASACTAVVPSAAHWTRTLWTKPAPRPAAVGADAAGAHRVREPDMNVDGGWMA